MNDMRNGVCPLCNHNEVIESVAAEFADNNVEKIAAVTYDSRWIMSGRNPDYAYGQLRMYVCRKCGYVQWFADDPHTIPVDEEHRTRLIKGPDVNSPYR